MSNLLQALDNTIKQHTTRGEWKAYRKRRQGANLTNTNFGVTMEWWNGK